MAGFYDLDEDLLVSWFNDPITELYIAAMKHRKEEVVSEMIHDGNDLPTKRGQAMELESIINDLENMRSNYDQEDINPENGNENP
jgi:hypothetical protein